MTLTPLKHIVFVPAPVWSHLRSGLKSAARMTDKFPNVFFSIFIFGPLVPKAAEYMSTQSTHTQQRIRLVSVLPPIPEPSADGSIEAAAPPQDPVSLILLLETLFGNWIIEELQKTSQEVNGFAIAPPTWIIEDHINGGISLASKAEHKLPIVSFWVAPAASLISHIGNAEHGLGGRLLESVAAAIDRGDLTNGNTLDDIFNQEVTSRLVCTPGLPPYYEHEEIPQSVGFLLHFTSRLIVRWNNFIQNVDHVSLCTTYEMEPVAAETFHQAFAKPVIPFFIGPAVDPPTPPSSEPTTSRSEVLEFLDRAYAECGPHSVVYVAFGTMFFPLPQSIGHLTILFDDILAKGLRLICSKSSDAAKMSGLSAEYLEKLVKSGQAIVPEWTEQLKVLEHPAMHYFISHGGWNSITESLVRGVPMIFWPFGADQPTNVLQIAAQQDCGFELLQIRTGPAKSTAYQRDSDVIVSGTDEAVRSEIQKVLEMSKGVRGDQQRRNAKALGKVILKSLEKGGSADVNLGRFGELLGLNTV